MAMISLNVHTKRLQPSDNQLALEAKAIWEHQTSQIFIARPRMVARNYSFDSDTDYSDESDNCGVDLDETTYPSDEAVIVPSQYQHTVATNDVIKSSHQGLKIAIVLSLLKAIREKKMALGLRVSFFEQEDKKIEAQLKELSMKVDDIRDKQIMFHEAWQEAEHAEVDYRKIAVLSTTKKSLVNMLWEIYPAVDVPLKLYYKIEGCLADMRGLLAEESEKEKKL